MPRQVRSDRNSCRGWGDGHAGWDVVELVRMEDGLFADGRARRDFLAEEKKVAVNVCWWKLLLFELEVALRQIHFLVHVATSTSTHPSNYNNISTADWPSCVSLARD